MQQRISVMAAGLVLLGLTGCGGGGDEGGQTGRMNLAVTDAPLDEASSVVVQFNAVAFKPQGAGEIVRTVLPAARQLDLLQYQEGRAALLLENIEMPAGAYEWVRLIVDNEPNVRDSYLVRTTGEECELRVPSGAESGLKLNRGFTLPADGSVALTIDFDLRQSIHAPPGQSGSTESCTQGYLMRPTLRIVDDANVGAIAGVVDSALVTETCMPKVYVYSGAGVVPDDIEEGAPAGDIDPLLVANVAMEDGGTEYRYRAAFLPSGSYTVAFTCGDDDPTADETVTFAPPKDATLQPNVITTVSFAPPAP